MSRPKVIDGKTNVVSIRLTDSEYAVLVGRARDAEVRAGLADGTIGPGTVARGVLLRALRDER